MSYRQVSRLVGGFFALVRHSLGGGDLIIDDSFGDDHGLAGGEDGCHRGLILICVCCIRIS